MKISDIKNIAKGYIESEDKYNFNIMIMSFDKKTKYNIFNEIYMIENRFNKTKREMVDMLFKDFNKYKVYCLIEEIENIFEDLKYEMTAEEVKCNNARIQYINN